MLRLLFRFSAMSLFFDRCLSDHASFFLLQALAYSVASALDLFPLSAFVHISCSYSVSSCYMCMCTRLLFCPGNALLGFGAGLLLLYAASLIRDMR
jgi:hypothetical protein